MKKLAIIGASYLQEPLISKAKDMGIETHVFAWECGDIGEKIADYFYPISIVEKEEILYKCREIGIDGICTISSDLAVITVNYIAEKMDLTGNSMECTEKSTNKYAMRNCFLSNGDPSPKSCLVRNAEDIKYELNYPVIVKPVDRSGSRGITKVLSSNMLQEAINNAKEQGFRKEALVEEFVQGQEYSVECISWDGEHIFLALTKKYTTGAPNFVETGHLEPAPVDESTLSNIKKVVFHALDSLGIQFGASHSELKIDKNGNISIIEIGGRMGGDFIGSSLVEHSTGIDYVKAVIEIALGQKPDLRCSQKTGATGVRFVFSHEDIEVYNEIKREHPEYLLQYNIPECACGEVKDSSSRFGYFIVKAYKLSDIEKYFPKTGDID